MEPVTVIFSAVNAGKSIAEYLGLIESINPDIKALLHQSFNSAKMNLEYAKDATSENQRDYILQAKNDFIKAIVVEKGTNLVTSYLGLAVCQYLLGDITNARNSLRKIRAVKLSKEERNDAIIADIATDISVDIVGPSHKPDPFSIIVGSIKHLFGQKGYCELFAERKFDEYKSECIKYLDLKQLNDKIEMKVSHF